MSLSIPEFFKDIVRKVKTVPTVSTFVRDGKITPEEFVIAGELLNFKCPTWRWDGGEESRRFAYLPPEKQCLVTRGIPCRQRATFVTRPSEEATVEQSEEDEEGWLATNLDDHTLQGQATEAGDEIPEIPDAPTTTTTSTEPTMDEIRRLQEQAEAEESSDEDDDEEIPDMDDFNMPEDDDAAALPTASAVPDAADAPQQNIVRCRTYDISITYDIYYQSPRVWLFGYSEAGAPLTREEIFEDISEDHARKTVTIETHPNLGVPMATIHPCKHASVMKSMVERMADSDHSMRVDQYFFLFLKFISAVIPTVEYDYTMSMST